MPRKKPPARPDPIPDPDTRAVSRSRLKANASGRRSRGAAPVEGEVRERKLGEKIAFAIKRDIADAGWPVGKVLGNQVQLMRRYKVSRSTLREAVRQIERHGVARMRRGIGGGLVVQQPARDAAVFALASYLELAAVSLKELYEARELLEGLMVELAVEHATEADLRHLRTLDAQLLAAPVATSAETVAVEIARHFELRAAIAALPRNPALALLIESLYRVTSDMLTVSADDPRMPDLERAARREKHALVEALLGADDVSGRLEVRNAIKRSRRLVDGALKGSGVGFEQASALSLSAEAEGIGIKLGHRISLRIARDIAASGAEPGSRVGAEPELCERYGVSRAVFREALRTLELHSIVELRRGYSGGLVVGRADPSYTVELATIYFQYARLKPRHFYELWRSLQIASAQLAASRIGAAGRRRLEAVVAAQAAASREEISAVHGRLHLEVGELSGNRVLALFIRIMADIASYYPTGIPPPETWAVLANSHAEVAAAIGAGDASLARRLMARHMKLVDAWYGNAQREAWLHALEESATA